MSDKYCYTFTAKDDHIRRCNRDSKGRCNYNDCEDIPIDKLNQPVAREFKRFRNALARYEFKKSDVKA